jgi:hypothetical protein
MHSLRCLRDTLQPVKVGSNFVIQRRPEVGIEGQNFNRFQGDVGGRLESLSTPNKQHTRLPDRKVSHSEDGTLHGHRCQESDPTRLGIIFSAYFPYGEK